MVDLFLSIDIMSTKSYPKITFLLVYRIKSGYIFYGEILKNVSGAIIIIRMFDKFVTLIEKRSRSHG